MAKNKIHSEFRCRYSLVLRAPVGDDPRSRLMQDLVNEMSFLKSTDMHAEWIVQAMLDRLAREQVSGVGVGAMLGQPMPRITRNTAVEGSGGSDRSRSLANEAVEETKVLHEQVLGGGKDTSLLIPEAVESFYVEPSPKLPAGIGSIM